MRSQEPTAKDLEQDIERQRDELAVTVDQLAAKFDVKARANARLTQTRAAITTDTGAPRPEVFLAAGAAAATVIALWWRRNH